MSKPSIVVLVLPEIVEQRLARPPIVVVVPALDQRPDLLGVGALAGVGDGASLRPAQAGQSITQVGQLLLGNRQGHRLDERGL